MRDRALIPLRLNRQLGTGESVTFAYPTGTSMDTWIGGAFSAVAGQEALTAPLDFTLVFEESGVQFVWKRAWPAIEGTALRIVLHSYAPPLAITATVPLARFGFLDDGSATDGARIRTAIETAADDHLELLLPPPGAFADGLRLDAAADLTGKSGFKLTGTGTGAIISKRGGSFGFAEWDNVSSVVFDNVGFDSRNGEAAFVTRECSDLTFRRLNATTGRIFRLYDGTNNVLFDRCVFDNPTAAVQFGEGIGGAVPGQADVTDITLRDVEVYGSKGEAFEWANGVRRLNFIRVRCYDCNTQQNQEVLDVGGPAEDIYFYDLLVDNTGAFSSYTSTAVRGVFVKRANGVNPVNVWFFRPIIRMSSASADSRCLVFDQVDGGHIRGGLMTGDTERTIGIGGGTTTLGDGLQLVGAREASIYAAGAATVRGVSRIYPEPAGGGVATTAIGGSTIDLAA
jgi:hypothetical protein